MKTIKDIRLIDKIFYQLLIESQYPEVNLFKWIILQCWYDLYNDKKGVLTAISFLISNNWEWKKQRETVCDIAFLDSYWLDVNLLQGAYLGYKYSKKIRNRICDILSQFEKNSRIING